MLSRVYVMQSVRKSKLLMLEVKDHLLTFYESGKDFHQFIELVVFVHEDCLWALKKCQKQAETKKNVFLTKGKWQGASFSLSLLAPRSLVYADP